MKNDLKVLFITEKWCDGLPYKGLTNNFHNLFGTFKLNFPEIKFSMIHMDEVGHTHKTHIDSIIESVLEKTTPDFVIFSLLGKSNLNPTEHTYKILKNKNIKMIFMWPDVGIDWGKPQIENELKNYADLHVCWGTEKNLNIDDKILWMWAPQSEKLYHPISEEKKIINCSFVGSPRYEERQKYLRYLIDRKLDVSIRGGQREESLTPEEYASIIRSSKISLNFPYCPSGFDQCKGRVWEILASRTLLLERKNIPTSLLLKPGVHYVEFINEKDLEEKINYYLKNNEERIAIQNNGYNFYMEKYNSKIFWNKIFNELGVQ